MAERGEALSEREIEVLQRVAVGESNKVIADELSISPFTVKTHLRNIYTKLDVSTRTEAMNVALQQGLLTVWAPGEAYEDEPREPVAASASSMSTGSPPGNGPASGPVPVQRQQPHRWRAVSVALLALLLLVVAIFIYVQWRERATGAQAESLYEEQSIGDTRWLTSRPIPEAQAGRAAEAVGLDVYVLGGETEEGVSAEVRVFDTGQRTWRRAASKPTPVGEVTAAELFGEIYVPGGRLADGTLTDIVEAYSPSQDAWRRLAPLPQPLAGGLTIADSGFLYVFGGRNDGGPLNAAYVYDPSADSWRPVAPLPEPRTGATGGALTGRLYVVGGSDGNTSQRTCFAYAPARDEWADCPEMLLPRAGAGATVLLNKLYVIGGTEPAGSQAASLEGHGEVLDPNSGIWTVLNLPPELDQWTEPGVTHVETRIYALGGRRGEQLSDATLFYLPLAFQTYIPAAPSDAED